MLFRRPDTSQSELNQLRNELVNERRKCLEQHSLIEGILRQRDEWKQMYKLQVQGHLNAQAMMEKHIIKLRQQLYKALCMLNEMRKERDLDPVHHPKDLGELDAHPVGTAEDYAHRMAHAKALVSGDIDGIAERDRIVSS